MPRLTAALAATAAIVVLAACADHQQPPGEAERQVAQYAQLVAELVDPLQPGVAVLNPGSPDWDAVVRAATVLSWSTGATSSDDGLAAVWSPERGLYVDPQSPDTALALTLDIIRYADLSDAATILLPEDRVGAIVRAAATVTSGDSAGQAMAGEIALRLRPADPTNRAHVERLCRDAARATDARDWQRLLILPADLIGAANCPAPQSLVTLLSELRSLGGHTGPPADVEAWTVRLHAAALFAGSVDEDSRAAIATAATRLLEEAAAPARPFIAPVDPATEGAIDDVHTVSASWRPPADTLRWFRRVVDWQGRLPQISINDPMSLLMAVNILDRSADPATRSAVSSVAHTVARPDLSPAPRPLDSAIRQIVVDREPDKGAIARVVAQVAADPRPADIARLAGLILHTHICTDGADVVMRVEPARESTIVNLYYAALRSAAHDVCAGSTEPLIRDALREKIVALMNAAFDSVRAGTWQGRATTIWLSLDALCALKQPEAPPADVAAELARGAGSQTLAAKRASFDLIDAYATTRLLVRGGYQCGDAWFAPG